MKASGTSGAESGAKGLHHKTLVSKYTLIVLSSCISLRWCPTPPPRLRYSERLEKHSLFDKTLREMMPCVAHIHYRLLVSRVEKYMTKNGIKVG